MRSLLMGVLVEPATGFFQVGRALDCRNVSFSSLTGHYGYCSSPVQTFVVLGDKGVVYRSAGRLIRI